MRGYLANASCNGRRPKKVGPQRIYSRPRLVKRLVSERQVARFIVAPSGFGKTSLALEYAGSIFSFVGVYWLDCQSPCFLRDLDSSAMAETLLASSDSANLAVFDDVPYLDDARLERFSEAIDSLMDAGCEVLIAATPAFCPPTRTQRDCVIVDARDLLIDDSEATASRLERCCNLEKCDRVPAFLWGGGGGMSEFLRGMRFGEMPAEIRSAAFAMAVLESGTFDELAVVLGGLREDDLRFMAASYPYLGIDMADETFESHRFEISQIVEGLGDFRRGEPSLTDAYDELSPKLACLLLSRGAGARACEIVQATCSRKRRIAWLSQQGPSLLDAGCAAPAQKLFESLGSRYTGFGASMLSMACFRLALLGDFAAARDIALRVLGSSGASAVESFACALVVLLSQDEASKERSVRAVESSVLLGDGDSQMRDCARGLVQSAAFLASGDVRSACEALSDISVPLGLMRIAAAHAAFLLGKLPSGSPCDFASGLIESSASMRDALGRRFETPTVFEAMLSSELSRLGMAPDMSAHRASLIDEMLISLAAQRETGRFDRAARESLAIDRGDSNTTIIPEMRVNIFGGMEVSIGDATLDPNGFSRQSTKTLLAVLVLFRGKEVPRPELLRILWPNASEERATNNFYSLWCKLRQALGASKNDECPYLVRHRTSVMINSHYVKTDVEEFESLCRTLMFDEPNPRSWLAIFERMEEGFSCDLLPSETENSYIASMRQKYRVRRVDAYVTAAMRLVDAGEPAAALWFANAALESAPGREDAYFVLMRAQSGSGQRVQAMETYRSCGKYLSQNLGIDVSERMSDLYAELLEGKA